MAERPQLIEPMTLVVRWVAPEVRALALDGPTVKLGRSERADVHLVDAQASREHAALTPRGHDVELRDLGSTNGTFINGLRVERAIVEAGDVIRIGDHLGVFCLERKGHLCSGFRELLPGIWGSETLADYLGTFGPNEVQGPPILLVGEPGSGKRQMATALHRLSGREGQLVCLDHLALSESLARGLLAVVSISAASASHVGEGTTVVLPPLDELPAGTLGRLDEFLSSYLAAQEPSPSKRLRIIMTSLSPLEELAQQGRIRRALSEQLAESQIHLPPLRDRREDIVPLFRQFLTKYQRSELSPSSRCLERLCLYDWPGNTRELGDMAEHLCSLTGVGPEIHRSDLPEHLLHPANQETRPEIPSIRPGMLSTPRAEDLSRALHSTRGNLAGAAVRLGISRQRAYRLLASLSPEQLMQRFPRE